VAFFLAVTRLAWRNWLTILIVFPLMLKPGGAPFVLDRPARPNGLVNQALHALGIVDSPGEAALQLRRLLIAMTHIFLPFMCSCSSAPSRHPARRRGCRAGAGRLLGQHVLAGSRWPLSAAGHSVGLDPRSSSSASAHW